MAYCNCGCDKITKGGLFLPGHDQKLRAKIENKVCGLLQLKELVQFSVDFMEERILLDDYGMMIRDIFDLANRQSK